MAIFLLLFIVATVLTGGIDAKNQMQPAKLLSEIEKHQKLLNRPAIKSIKSEDGDVIDCVDIYKQPALSHPLLRNHNIQLKPNYNERQSRNESSAKAASQVWHRSGKCPINTVPIRQVQKHHLLGHPDMQRYGKKPREHINPLHTLNSLGDNFTIGTEKNHSYGVLLEQSYNYIAAKGEISTWNPRVEADDEYSSAQIWVMGGQYNNADSIEVGWIVHPSLYRDRKTRLFAYWTRDSGKTSGCFDLLCPGFVQTSNGLALGGVIDQVSWVPGPQYHITYYVYQDVDTGNWWLEVDGVTMGYWPAELFNVLAHAGTLVKWGGDVYSPRFGMKPHTSTAMGSGEFADGMFYSASIRWPRIMDYSKELKYPQTSIIHGNDYYCYSIRSYAEQLFTEPTFYFGGPGRNFLCP